MASRSGVVLVKDWQAPEPALWAECRAALEDQYGPLGLLAALQADFVAQFMVTVFLTMQRHNQAIAKRRAGRGRRPSLDAIGRLGKRQGLDYSSYDLAVRRLEELTAPAKARKSTPADLVARLRAGGGA